MNHEKLSSLEISIMLIQMFLDEPCIKGVKVNAHLLITFLAAHKLLSLEYHYSHAEFQYIDPPQN